ncbi:MAG: hypothetical protein GC134_00475 [Proteobacteria bacterium]|nr:hypothetical protein [Pseudomonadota bacterium]
MQEPQAGQTYCLIKIGGKYAQVSPDGTSITMLASMEGATLFPPEIAKQLIEALKSHGVQGGIELEEITPQG